MGGEATPTVPQQPAPPPKAQPAPQTNSPSSVRPEGGQLLPEEEAKTSVVANSDDAPTGDRLYAEWGMVLARLVQTNPGLAGILEGSSAMTRGDIVLIKCNNPATELFIRRPENAEAIKEAIFQVSDRKVKLQIFKGDTTPPPKDPLAELAARAEKL